MMLCRCEAKGFRPHGHIVDISLGGAGIVGTKELPAEELAVSILLPGSSIKLSSRLVWTNSKANKGGLADFGVEFLDSLSERQEKLTRFFPQHNAIEG
jgi:c-di-GMP-binding flagellar brake protein YcgR